jgi:hypothetical protein
MIKRVILSLVVITGLLWALNLAWITVYLYFYALFNGTYQAGIVIDKYGEYVYETPIIIVACAVILFSLVYSVRATIRFVLQCRQLLCKS